MNTFNENLRSSILGTLNDLETEQKKINSAENAAMFTLYHAQGATFDAVLKQEAAKKEQNVREKIKRAAVNNNNLSNNLLKSADQVSQYLKQSVTNMAVGASNVQIAANAIVRLSGDVGNILNIISASDKGSDIYKLAADANDKVSETANEAEYASQLAMESSILTSKVSSDSVLSNAKVSNDAVNNLLKVVSANYDAISETVLADNTELAAISASEKIAEGVYEDKTVVRKSTTAALLKSIGQLNLGLSAYPKMGNEHNAFVVNFNFLKSPFTETKDPDSVDDGKFPDPVLDYYLFLVKEKQKSTFSISKAKDIVGPSKDDNDKETSDTTDRAYIHLKKDGNTTDVEDAFEAVYTYAQIPDSSNKTYHLKDTDGDDITTGENYVAFLMANFDQKYKEKLNTFDDFLSAPSEPFCLTTYLAKPVIIDQHLVVDIKSKNNNEAVSSNFLFYTQEETEIFDKTEYRCIYLPVSEALTHEMTNSAELKKLDSDIEKLTDSLGDISAEISELAEKLNDNQVKLITLKKLHRKPCEKIEHFFKEENDKKPLSLKIDDEVKLSAAAAKYYNLVAEKYSHLNNVKDKEKTELDDFIKNVIIRISLTSKLNKLKSETKDIEDHLSVKHRSKIDFVFNQKIAEQVSAGNYTVVNPIGEPKKYLLSGQELAIVKTNFNESHNAKFKEKLKEKAAIKFFNVSVEPDATDNFGNPLLKDKRYIPVILAVSTEHETVLAGYTNAWSGYNAKAITI